MSVWLSLAFLVALLSSSAFAKGVVVGVVVVKIFRPRVEKALLTPGVTTEEKVQHTSFEDKAEEASGEQ